MGKPEVLDEVERWGTWELSLDGPTDGNPFLDVQLNARFEHKHRAVEVDGFYDGKGIYRFRFMPDVEGTWRYVTRSNRPGLDGVSGQFACVAPSSNNHGPVRVTDADHFTYEDGTPYTPVGTTCYAWVHQGDELEEQTLETLGRSPFDKLRMCVFPKDYVFNRNEPIYYPFERDEAGEWDFARFDPAFWAHLELRIGQLRDLGIEADVILFHPYDRWGFADMGAEADDRYLRYAVARLAAYRNVWWSMANEYDLMEAKTMTDWDRFFRVVQESDPYQHLRSIHNCRRFYDHGKPWVTHCSIQSHDMAQIPRWRERYRKPIVMDEVCYEGNIQHRWGNIPAQELVHRFWEGFTRGGYVGHGETYLHPQDVLWWSKGGVLHGQSPERIDFLCRILEAAPVDALSPVSDGPAWTDRACIGTAPDYYLCYLGRYQPAVCTLDLPEGYRYTIDLIDTWAMTVTPLDGAFENQDQVELPGEPYLALRLQRMG